MSKKICFMYLVFFKEEFLISLVQGKIFNKLKITEVFKMKKLLVLIMTLVLTLSLIACGSASDNSTTETKFVTKTFGNITINVPDVFGQVKEENEMYISAAPGASLVVSYPMEVQVKPSEWEENSVAEALDTAYGSVYTDLSLESFEKDVNMNGNEAVYYGFSGKSPDGTKMLVQMVTVYNADLTEQYVVTFTQKVDDEVFTSDIASEIINSITLVQEAQH